ncbi:hypothetical protein [Paenibacillus sp. MMS20-IR301]|uniref:hypothetical protein n=1 Tax=Paenibacillus sp. MMS20-IR301 TaxID=2895946 RepID=UPI0028E3615C|nr:hypothetical protein [Paenibacillus sp. MMS20-IR301]WNS41295.1 hypothetical protein LOS79_19910 [Paenibacillus sp. MMS20-IR301]
MGNEFNKTEADFVYERYTKMGSIPPEQDIPLEERRPLGTITEQSPGTEASDNGNQPLESALASHDPANFTPIDFDGVVDDGSDPALVGDNILAADIGLNVPDSGLGPRSGRTLPSTGTPGPERDELLESAAIYAAGAAGLTGSVIDYADEEDTAGEWTDGDELPLEDIPDADDLAPGSDVDPVSPDLDAMPGTDVLNGSSGEEE